ncbi:hypothetical protein [Arthrobacter silviterrae]|uniref:Uncharacterized protein n=1 Tax=Arthrobacter silviterrae TaxID=2026658 RepID=A0ABX0D7V3_9MICC|nr:hypothetical protein [Arthrobacter silviterrae]NGN82977.1 hypothetical protein [Arthrobacter silviterrae]
MRSTPTRLERHLKWAVPLAAAPLIYLGAMFAAWLLVQGAGSGNPGIWRPLAELALYLVAIAGPLAALVRAAINGHRAFRHWRRENGHFTKSEAVVAQRHDSSARSWAQARHLRSCLLRGEAPQAVQVWDVVANPGEVFFMDVPADYARHYGMDVTFTQTSGIYFGRPAFVLAGLGLTAMSNAAKRNAANRQAAVQWRERQPCRLVVGNQRLLCQVGGQWLSFYFSAVTAVYPEIDNWSLITQYGSTSPLMLSGEHVPSAALFTVLATHGVEAVSAHPSLQRLGAGNPGKPGSTEGGNGIDHRVDHASTL